LCALAVLGGCSPLAQTSTPPTTSPSSPTVSPSPVDVLRGLWVLSPLGLNLRDQPDTSAKVLASVPQGTQLTADQFRAGDPGWYHVDYQGVKGWLAATAPHSNPTRPLVTTHPQLAYGSLAAGYFLLYPSTWTVVDHTPDVEIDAPGAQPITAPSPGASPAHGPVTAPRLVVHTGKDSDSLGATPTTPGSLLNTITTEVYGITCVERTYSLNGGGIEADIKLQMAPGKWALLNYRAASDKDLATFDEIAAGFGVSLSASPSPHP
jgi:hypothetical protein